MTAPGTSLLGRGAPVTGGGRGLGRAMAISLARAGAGVVVTARSEQELDNTTAHLPPRVAKHVVADIDAGKRLYAEAVYLSGAVDAVINNAGNVLYPFIPLPEFTLEEAGFVHESRVLDGPDLRPGR